MSWTALDQLPDTIGDETSLRSGCVAGGVPYWFNGDGSAWKFTAGVWSAVASFVPAFNGQVLGALLRSDGHIVVVVSNGSGTATFTWDYNVAGNSWDDGSVLTGMITPRRDAVCGVLGGKLIVAGGYQSDPSAPEVTTERYDPETDTWDALADLDVGLERGMGAEARGRLWCFARGGADTTMLGRVLEPTGWAPLTVTGNMDGGVVFAALGVILVGRGFSSTDFGIFEWFDPASRTFSDEFSAVDSVGDPVFFDVVEAGIDGLTLSAIVTGGTASLATPDMLTVTSLDHRVVG